VAEQFLDCTDVIPVFQQMRGERVAQRVAAGILRDTSGTHGRLHWTLNRRLVETMPPLLTASRIN
jgi:hypothetical protein